MPNKQDNNKKPKPQKKPGLKKSEVKKTKSTKKQLIQFIKDPDKNRFLNAYISTHRHISQSCKLAGISRSLLYSNWMKDPIFLSAFNEAEESFFDMVNSKVFGIIENIKIKKPDKTAVSVLLEVYKKSSNISENDRGKLDELSNILNPNNYK